MTDVDLRELAEALYDAWHALTNLPRVDLGHLSGNPERVAAYMERERELRKEYEQALAAVLMDAYQTRERSRTIMRNIEHARVCKEKGRHEEYLIPRDSERDGQWVQCRQCGLTWGVDAEPPAPGTVLQIG